MSNNFEEGRTVNDLTNHYKYLEDTVKDTDIKLDKEKYNTLKKNLEEWKDLYKSQYPKKAKASIDGFLSDINTKIYEHILSETGDINDVSKLHDILDNNLLKSDSKYGQKLISSISIQHTKDIQDNAKKEVENILMNNELPPAMPGAPGGKNKKYKRPAGARSLFNALSGLGNAKLRSVKNKKGKKKRTGKKKRIKAKGNAMVDLTAKALGSALANMRTVDKKKPKKLSPKAQARQDESDIKERKKIRDLYKMVFGLSNKARLNATPPKQPQKFREWLKERHPTVKYPKKPESAKKAPTPVSGGNDQILTDLYITEEELNNLIDRYNNQSYRNNDQVQYDIDILEYILENLSSDQFDEDNVEVENIVDMLEYMLYDLIDYYLIYHVIY